MRSSFVAEALDLSPVGRSFKVYQHVEKLVPSKSVGVGKSQVIKRRCGGSCWFRYRSRLLNEVQNKVSHIGNSWESIFCWVERETMEAFITSAVQHAPCLNRFLSTKQIQSNVLH
ncbi:hypothetical protein TNCV_3889041 [Trichonephila clavipes]|nr:hypothetical protein TNCV_3889041 [Trichonephila clavipes]